MLALALGHAPELLLLDDPTLGLDVVARDAVFREVIGDLADRGHHRLRDAPTTCGRSRGSPTTSRSCTAGASPSPGALEALKAERGLSLEQIFASVAGTRAADAAVDGGALVRKLLAVAARELRERWLLFPASFALGFDPLVLPAFGVDRRVDAAIVGLVDLDPARRGGRGGDGLDDAGPRRGERPAGLPVLAARCPGRTIWGGKWLAALVLVVSSGLLAAIPWMAAYPLASIGGHHGDSWLRAMLDGPGSARLLLVIVLVVGLANFNATAFRSRSPWVALDLVLLLAALWAIAAVRRSPVALRHPRQGRLDDRAGASAPRPRASRGQRGPGRRRPDRPAPGAPRDVARLLGRGRPHPGRRRGLLALGPVGGPGRRERARRDPRPRGALGLRRGLRASTAGGTRTGFLIDTASGRYLARPEPDEERERFRVGVLFSADGRFGALPRLDRDGRGAALEPLRPHRETRRASREVALESSPPPTWSDRLRPLPFGDLRLRGPRVRARRSSPCPRAGAWRPRRSGRAGARPPSASSAEGAARAWLVPWSAGRGALRAACRDARRGPGGRRPVERHRRSRSPTAFDSRGGWWGAVLPDADGRRIVTVGRRPPPAGRRHRRADRDARGGRRARFSVLFLADGRDRRREPRPAPAEPVRRARSSGSSTGPG